jgi:hypothetical protein
MARLTDQGISGLVGNMVFYIVDGKKYVRARPRVSSKNKKKKKDPDSLNGIFGTVSRYGSGMVKEMKNSFLFKLKLSAYNNARGWMRNLYAEHKDEVTWELSVKSSGMCQLNPEVDLRDFLRTDITVTDNGNGKILIIFPEICPKKDIKAPLRTMKVNIKLLVVSSPFRNDLRSYSFCKEHCSFIYNNDPVPAKTFELQANAGTGDVAIVAMAVEYEITDTGGGIYNKDIHWLPAAIIAMGKLK